MRSLWRRKRLGLMLRRPPRGKDSAQKRRHQMQLPPAFSKALLAKVGLLVLDPTLARTCPPMKGWWPAAAKTKLHTPGERHSRPTAGAHPSSSGRAEDRGVASEVCWGLALGTLMCVVDLAPLWPVACVRAGALHDRQCADLGAAHSLRDLVPFWLCSAVGVCMRDRSARPSWSPRRLLTWPVPEACCALCVPLAICVATRCSENKLLLEDGGGTLCKRDRSAWPSWSPRRLLTWPVPEACLGAFALPRP